MVYLAKFLTVVMHAGVINDERYGLVKRARESFLRDVNHVIVDAGVGPGSLIDPAFSIDQLNRKSQQQFDVNKGDLIDYWNSSWGMSSEPKKNSRRMLRSRQRRLFSISYPDNPGCTYTGNPMRTQKSCAGTIEKKPTYVQIGKYFGAQKPVLGIWVANQTWPNTAWTLVMDDDNAVIPSSLAEWLSDLDPDVPLLLSGLIGPKNKQIKCNEFANASHWGCCTDPRFPCRSFLTNEPQSIWQWNKTSCTMEVLEQCEKNGLKAECCHSEPWADGVKYRYPYKTSQRGTSFSPHFSNLWPYGGEGYILSRGLLNSISSEYWTHCMFALQCANADHRVMTCVFNAGYSPTFLGKFPTMHHHVRAPRPNCESMFTFEQNDQGELGLKHGCLTKEETAAEYESDAWAATRQFMGNAPPKNITNKPRQFKFDKMSKQDILKLMSEENKPVNHQTSSTTFTHYNNPYVIDGIENNIPERTNALIAKLAETIPPYSHAGASSTSSSTDELVPNHHHQSSSLTGSTSPYHTEQTKATTSSDRHRVGKFNLPGGSGEHNHHHDTEPGPLNAESTHSADTTLEHHHVPKFKLP